MNQLMAIAGERLNLKTHSVGPGGVAHVCGPADIEGHQGKDGLYYVVDTARLFPPEAPRAFLNAVLIPADSPVQTQWAQARPKPGKECQPKCKRDYDSSRPPEYFATESEAPDPVEDDPDVLTRLTISALVAAGEFDLPDFRDGAEAMASALPNARHVVIAGAGHLAPLETPEAFRELVLAFLG